MAIRGDAKVFLDRLVCAWQSRALYWSPSASARCNENEIRTFKSRLLYDGISSASTLWTNTKCRASPVSLIIPDMRTDVKLAVPSAHQVLVFIKMTSFVSHGRG